MWLKQRIAAGAGMGRAGTGSGFCSSPREVQKPFLGIAAALAKEGDSPSRMECGGEEGALSRAPNWVVLLGLPKSLCLKWKHFGNGGKRVGLNGSNPSPCDFLKPSEKLLLLLVAEAIRGTWTDFLHHFRLLEIAFI